MNPAPIAYLASSPRNVPPRLVPRQVAIFRSPVFVTKGDPHLLAGDQRHPLGSDGQHEHSSNSARRITDSCLPSAAQRPAAQPRQAPRRVTHSGHRRSGCCRLHRVGRSAGVTQFHSWMNTGHTNSRRPWRGSDWHLTLKRFSRLLERRFDFVRPTLAPAQPLVSVPEPPCPRVLTVATLMVTRIPAPKLFVLAQPGGGCFFRLTPKRIVPA